MTKVTVAGLFACTFGFATLLAQRELSWDALEVSARLDADGVLHVTEQQTIVFDGDWNGGERTFNLRPRQTFEFAGMERLDLQLGTRIPLVEDGSLDDIDEYAFTDSRTLRWRSRLPTDPPFSGRRITYAIHYRLSGILVEDSGGLRLDHDFAFPDRSGEIRRFALRLTLDDEWKASDLQETYTAGPLAPGQNFLLTIPLRYAGAGTPLVLDTRRPPEVQAAVAAILGVLVLAVGGLLVREQRLGRFAPVTLKGIDAEWIRRHILVHPAEVVGAAWDQDVDKDEVGALIARMVNEKKLAGSVGGSGSLYLDLKVDRDSLQSYERTLVDGLFFDGRTSTGTEAVRAHYKDMGFDPAKAIAPELLETVKALLPRGDNPTVRGWPSALLFVVGAGLLVREVRFQDEVLPQHVIVGVGALILVGLGQAPGVLFRQRIDWGFRALGWSLVIPVAAAAGASWYLWSVVGSGAAQWSPVLIGALAVLTIWIVRTATNGLKSRNHRDAIAFRKMLATGRLYFQRELEKPRPALSDEWHPWITAFGLTEIANQWAVRHPADEDSSRRSTTSTSSSSGGWSSEPVWTGAGGGRSGGAGGGAVWAAAVGGMAAGVSPPSSSSSSGSSGSSSSSSGSSGSSGGGGGGGW